MSRPWDWLRGRDLGPERTLLARRVFLVLLGAAYGAAFLSLWVQVDGLLGSAGIAPAARLLEDVEASAGAVRFWRLPTLLWLWRSDAALHVLCAAGTLASALLVAGIASRAVLVALFLLYTSLTSVGDTFLRYQWDSLLLETGFLAVFIAPVGLRPRLAAREPVDPIALWLLRFLLFKLMFMSGAVKLLSGDPHWRDLSAMQFHYWTQPLPTWSSWVANQLPAVVHTLSAALMFGVELGLPFLIFAPRRLRWAAAAGFVGLQLLIGTTGNYGFFNLTTVALCVLLVDDSVWRRLLPGRMRPALEAGAAWRRGWRPGRVVFAVVAALLFGISATRLLDRLDGPGWRPCPLRDLARATAHLLIANPYGLFAVMTTQRNEIELEGSADGETWLAYRFHWKPGSLERRPELAGFHMPRLDWQLWFAALRGCGGAPWFHAFMLRLLEGEQAVLGLLAENPFPEAPPRFLRSRLFAYRFSEPGEAGWWRRELVGPFCPTARLRGGRPLRAGPPGGRF